jgi:hypothetical protein
MTEPAAQAVEIRELTIEEPVEVSHPGDSCTSLAPLNDCG